MISYPFEIVSMENIKADNAINIGSISALFPCYRTNNPEFAKLVKQVDSNNHLVAVNVLRHGSIVAITTKDNAFCLNAYCFPKHYSDDKILSYLKKNLGWTKELIYRVTIPTVYKNCRVDVVSKGLYRWEDSTLPKVKLSKSKVDKLIALYLASFKVTVPYSVKYKLKGDELGVCGVIRRSGLVSRAVEYQFEFNPKHIYLHSVLHEVAHALDYHLYRSWIHGPTFLILYSNLLSDHFKIDALKELKKNKLFLGTG